MTNNWDKTAREVLRMCRDLDPRFYGAERQAQMVPAWAWALESSGITRRAALRAPAEHYANSTDDERPTIGQIIAAAKRWQQRYDNTPEGKAEAEKRRQARQEERDKQLAEGTWRPKGVR